MNLVVLSQKPRDNDMVEVELSADGYRLTAHVPTLVAESDNAMATYREIAARAVANRDRMQDTIQANGSV